MKDRLAKYGNLDYKYMKATIYRENFMTALIGSGAENMENYNLLKAKMDRIKNPLKFFEFITQSDIFKDIFEYYKPGEGVIYGNFSGDEERFNLGLEQLGLL